MRRLGLLVALAGAWRTHDSGCRAAGVAAAGTTLATCRIYLLSNVNGSYDLFVAERQP